MITLEETTKTHKGHKEFSLINCICIFFSLHHLSQFLVTPLNPKYPIHYNCMHAIFLKNDKGLLKGNYIDVLFDLCICILLPLLNL